MAKLREDTAGKIRDLPISNKLRSLLIEAATSVGIDEVVVTSGGQCAKGTCTKRTGSTRHDLGNAADLQLIKGGRRLNFTRTADLPTIKSFITATARLGATGIGAGLTYMGAETFHVGFGARAVWGGTGANAKPPPDWLVEAAKTGWRAASPGLLRLPENKSMGDAFADLPLMSDEAEDEDIAESVGDAAPPEQDDDI